MNPLSTEEISKKLSVSEDIADIIRTNLPIYQASQLSNIIINGINENPDDFDTEEIKKFKDKSLKTIENWRTNEKIKYSPRS